LTAEGRGQHDSHHWRFQDYAALRKSTVTNREGQEARSHDCKRCTHERATGLRFRCCNLLYCVLPVNGGSRRLRCSERSTAEAMRAASRTPPAKPLMAAAASAGWRRMSSWRSVIPCCGRDTKLFCNKQSHALLRNPIAEKRKTALDPPGRRFCPGAAPRAVRGAPHARSAPRAASSSR